MTEGLILFGNKCDYSVLAQAVEGNAKALGIMVETASHHGLCGRLNKSYIAWLLINDENAFSLFYEMNNDGSCDSLDSIAMHDLELIYDMYCDDTLADFNSSCEPTSQAAKNTVRLIAELSKAQGAAEFMETVKRHYRTYGVGMLGNNAAFHIADDTGLEFVPIVHDEKIMLNDLWGYEIQKKQLTDNTQAFLAGKIANNALLYGDAGTGKSTCCKALLNEYSAQGLRMVEIYKHQFSKLPELIHSLRDRNYKFIIFMDDLSFEDFEVEYKYLKAVIEGGLEKKPENVVIYATSNRRHLIRETFSEREAGDDIHVADTIEEKLSLADRFGVSICFVKPLQSEYFEIVTHLARENGIDMDITELHSLARKWGMRRSGMSGRVAQQFINHLLGK